MTKALERAALILAICIGVLAFILARFLLNEYASLLIALVVGVGMRLLIPYVLTADDRKYADIEQKAGAPVLMREPVGVKDGKKARLGYLLMTADTLFFFCRDKKTSLEFSVHKDDIESLTRSGASAIRLVTRDGAEREFGSRLADQIMQRLTAQGFGRADVQ